MLPPRVSRGARGTVPGLGAAPASGFPAAGSLARATLPDPLSRGRGPLPGGSWPSTSFPTPPATAPKIVAHVELDIIPALELDGVRSVGTVTARVALDIVHATIIEPVPAVRSTFVVDVLPRLDRVPDVVLGHVDLDVIPGGTVAPVGMVPPASARAALDVIPGVVAMWPTVAINGRTDLDIVPSADGARPVPWGTAEHVIDVIPGGSGTPSVPITAEHIIDVVPGGVAIGTLPVSSMKMSFATTFDLTSRDTFMKLTGYAPVTGTHPKTSVVDNELRADGNGTWTITAEWTHNSSAFATGVRIMRKRVGESTYTQVGAEWINPVSTRTVAGPLVVEGVEVKTGDLYRVEARHAAFANRFVLTSTVVATST